MTFSAPGHQQAPAIGGNKAKKGAIAAALAKFLPRHNQKRMVKLFGSIEYGPAYDYKAARWRKRSV